MIKKLERQEEKLLSTSKEVINQWRGSLLVFAGLAMAALGNQHDAFAYLLIVLWLIEALFILLIFLINRDIYNLMINRHFEDPVSEEQERNDVNYAEKKHRQTRVFERLTLFIFFLSVILTMIYFLVEAFGRLGIK